MMDTRDHTSTLADLNALLQAIADRAEMPPGIEGLIQEASKYIAAYGALTLKSMKEAEKIERLCDEAAELRKLLDAANQQIAEDKQKALGHAGIIEGLRAAIYTQALGHAGKPLGS